ncbi:iron-sulfur cluster assembly accessory protein [Rhizobium sp. BK176]|uniref:HesB/IscA family protein n=1 Tax=Rhizobium sp. BK176 TaxID=2587071 RepID=UPI0021684C15|nr:iron-sulfur cluster assembly accessory protein [Rhizobium sp. BK176]MCS4088988.1 iron-sulfur cluster assembly accessory protein [Rhizobium sp. BK176]
MAKILNITPAAAERIKELAVSHVGQRLRLSVVKSGCSGNGYDLSFVEDAGPVDEKVCEHGAEVLVDSKSLLMVFGMTIDWKEDRFGRQFTFENPLEAGRCGCGASFHM